MLVDVTLGNENIDPKAISNAKYLTICQHYNYYEGMFASLLYSMSLTYLRPIRTLHC